MNKNINKDAFRNKKGLQLENVSIFYFRIVILTFLRNIFAIYMLEKF